MSGVKETVSGELYAFLTSTYQTVYIGNTEYIKYSTTFSAQSDIEIFALFEPRIYTVTIEQDKYNEDNAKENRDENNSAHVPPLEILIHLVWGVFLGKQYF